MNYLYKNWPKVGGVAGIFILLLLFFNSRAPIGSVVWFFWLLLPLYMVHQFEEYVLPGGFKEQLNEMLMKRPSPDFPANDQRVFWVNILYIWIYVPVCAIIGLKFIIFPLSAVAFTILNGLLHIGSGIIRRRYNPGLAASIVLNVPVGSYVIFRMVNEGLLNSGQLTAGISLAVFLHALLIAYFLVIRGRKNITA